MAWVLALGPLDPPPCSAGGEPEDEFPNLYAPLAALKRARPAAYTTLKRARPATLTMQQARAAFAALSNLADNVSSEMTPPPPAPVPADIGSLLRELRLLGPVRPEIASWPKPLLFLEGPSWRLRWDEQLAVHDVLLREYTRWLREVVPALPFPTEQDRQEVMNDTVKEMDAARAVIRAALAWRETMQKAVVDHFETAPLEDLDRDRGSLDEPDVAPNVSFATRSAVRRTVERRKAGLAPLSVMPRRGLRLETTVSRNLPGEDAPRAVREAVLRYRTLTDRLARVAALPPVEGDDVDAVLGQLGQRGKPSDGIEGWFANLQPGAERWDSGALLTETPQADYDVVARIVLSAATGLLNEIGVAKILNSSVEQEAEATVAALTRALGDSAARLQALRANVRRLLETAAPRADELRAWVDEVLPADAQELFAQFDARPPAAKRVSFASPADGVEAVAARFKLGAGDRKLWERLGKQMGSLHGAATGWVDAALAAPSADAAMKAAKKWKKP